MLWCEFLWGNERACVGFEGGTVVTMVTLIETSSAEDFREALQFSIALLS